MWEKLRSYLITEQTEWDGLITKKQRRKKEWNSDDDLDGIGLHVCAASIYTHLH
jgi:hypothetical protein